METKFTYISVDDEKATHLILDHFLKSFPDLVFKGHFSDPLLALHYLNENQIDLLFLDVDMPYLNGFELLDQMQNRPLTIMITAHAQKYALNGYQYIDKGVIDFIEKPIEKERLEVALNRFFHYKKDLKKSNDPIEKILETTSNETIQVQKKDKWFSIFVKEIKMISVSGNYVFINTINDEHYSKYCSLEDMLNSLPTEFFIQVNRQQVVNVFQIQSFNKDTLNMGKDTLGHEILIPISVRRRTTVLTLIETIKNKLTINN
ncbi:MAG TPA: LytTR family DNA-binding domain-containing protein [Bacteroidales bacterium]|nr:LytTR family DNA-binding domain-containing protein [Bacteroidales bacterium]